MAKDFADMGKGEKPDIEAHVRDLSVAHDEVASLLLEWSRKPPTMESRQELLGAALHYNFIAAGILVTCWQIATHKPASHG